jgi:hypothetical protein
MALETHATARAPADGVSYALHWELEPRFRAALSGLVDGGAKRIFDIGGGAIPAIALRRIQSAGLEYVLVDESAQELERAPEGYEGVQADVLDREALARLVRERGPADGVISCWAAEHIRDGERFHRNVFEILRPGGTAVHLFSTLYALPFVVNRVLSSEHSAKLLARVQPERKAKFGVYYSWCRGPSARQLAGLRAIGYTVRSYTGFFGHAFYASVKPLNWVHGRVAQTLVEHPVPALTSFALVVLERPD